jgi:hypothetical protein
MSQFLMVVCGRPRPVLIGGDNHGTTGELIELHAAGPYTVTLKLEEGETCAPVSCEVNPMNTTALRPLVVEFVLA